jgi:methylenetetrahydrofolate dehydrogenase (NADP+)/methenyltetrahydrofolate cyclohydrolase
MVTCKELAQKIKNEVKSVINTFTENDLKKPKLVIFSNEAPDGLRYIRNKVKVAEEVGIEAEVLNVKSNMTFDEIKDTIANQHDATGIIVQLPFTGNKDKDQELIDCIPCNQDVDGLKGRVVPATALGVYEYLRENDLINGKRITIIGRSKLVGMPLAKMLLETDATVTLCHSKTTDLQCHTLEADVIVSAVGKINLINQSLLWFDQDYHIVDVGINFDKNGIMCGDVSNDVEAMDNVTCTPVPGGVGLLTTACLMKNTLSLYNK